MPITTAWFEFQTAEVNTGVGTNTWTDTSYILANDANYAVSIVGSGSSGSADVITNWIVQRNLLHTMEVGGWKKILGIEYSVNAAGFGTNGYGRPDSIKIWQLGAVGNDQSPDTNYTSSFVDYTYGNSVNNWGVPTLKVGDINSNFGVAFSGRLVGVNASGAWQSWIRLQYAKMRFTLASNFFFF